VVRRRGAASVGARACSGFTERCWSIPDDAREEISEAGLMSWKRSGLRVSQRGSGLNLKRLPIPIRAHSIPHEASTPKVGGSCLRPAAVSPYAKLETPVRARSGPGLTSPLA
jgi:hypothetical protein